MANVLNRTTKQFLTSVNTPDYSEADWIVNPDLAAVAGFSTKYWDIQGDVVTLMDDAARTTADAAEVTAIKAQETAVAEAIATKALADADKVPSPAGVLATLEERVRALELKVYGG